MPDKFDCFGIAHRDTCKRPSWATISGRIGQATAQRCSSCGLIWRKGDGQLTARAATYGQNH